MKIFHTATTPGGLRLEYRASLLATIVGAVHRNLYLPLALRRWVGHYAIQRRIDGGPWVTIGGAQ